MKHPLALAALDDNPEIRKQLLARLIAVANKTPVIVLHQAIQMLEIGVEEKVDHSAKINNQLRAAQLLSEPKSRKRK